MKDVFFDLLQVSLGTREAFSRVPSDAEWQAIFEEAQRQAVVGVFTDGLEHLPSEQRPPKDLLLQWIGLVQMMESQYALHCQRAKEATELFKGMRVGSCVLKGIGFAQYYPNHSRRQCGDIDLLVEGDRQEIMSCLKKRYETGLNTWHHTDVKLFDDVETEIHFHPGWLYNPFVNRRLQRWFDGQTDAQMKVDGSLGFAHPAVQFDAVFSLIHSYHHLIEEGLGLRHIIDYYYILRYLPTDDKKTVTLLLKRFRMMRLAGAMMWVLKEVCGMDEACLLCEPNEKEGRFLLDEIMRGGNFGHYRSDNRKRNSATRMLALLPHYPSEVLWVVPWKLWHKCWRMVNG